MIERTLLEDGVDMIKDRRIVAGMELAHLANAAFHSVGYAGDVLNSDTPYDRRASMARMQLVAGREFDMLVDAAGALIGIGTGVHNTEILNTRVNPDI